MRLKAFLLKNSERLLNAHIRASAQSDQYLLPLLEKKIGFELLTKGPAQEAQPLYLSFHKEGVVLSSDRRSQSADFVIFASPVTLAGLMLGTITLPHPEVKLQGDIHYLLDFKRLMQKTGFDFFAWMNQILGVSFAIEEKYKAFRSYQSERMNHFVEELDEYLQFEQDFIINGAQQTQYFEDIQQLTKDVERLHWRIEKLSAKVSKNQEQLTPNIASSRAMPSEKDDIK